jgi:hypothetical protein
VLSSSIRVKYAIELTASGLEETSVATASPIRERLAKLRMLQTAYKAAHFTYSHCVTSHSLAQNVSHQRLIQTNAMLAFCYSFPDSPFFPCFAPPRFFDFSHFPPLCSVWDEANRYASMLEDPGILCSDARMDVIVIIDWGKLPEKEKP